MGFNSGFKGLIPGQSSGICGGQSDLGTSFPWVLWHSPVRFILRMLHIISSHFRILAIIWESGIYSKTKLSFSSHSRPKSWSKQMRWYFRKINNPLFTGYDNGLRILLIFWLHMPVRYAGVCSLQSAGEAQSGAAGCQTDTRHIRAELQKRGWP